MAINDMDYKLQGRKLEIVIAEVISRQNSIAGRYEKGGGFGLDFWSKDYEIENYNWISRRADMADRKIMEAQLDGKDIDSPETLREIAGQVDEIIRKEKKQGSIVNYLLYLVLPVVMLVIVIYLLK